MDFSTVRRWWTELGRGPGAFGHHEPDRGNMGTAFALDASLDSAARDPHPVETQPGVWALSWEERAARRGL